MTHKPGDFEVERLKRVYAGYGTDPAVRSRWDSANAGNQAILSERRRVMSELLRTRGYYPLDGYTILEVGCGEGQELARLQEWGARREQLYGVDLLSERVAAARRLHPGIHFECANAERLCFPDHSFDLVFLFTVLSSVLDQGMASNITTEVARVLKPSGAVLWYDLRYNNPYNSETRGVKLADIRRYFPGFKIEARTLTLLPPLARHLGSYTRVLYPVLSAVSFLRSHTLALLTKK